MTLWWVPGFTDSARYLVDYISLEPAAPRAEHNITDKLVDPNANNDTCTLYRYLMSIYGEKILSGQQDLSWADYVADKVGKFPALLSVDLMDYRYAPRPT